MFAQNAQPAEIPVPIPPLCRLLLWLTLFNFLASAPLHADPTPSADALLRAYPTVLDRIEGRDLVWRDGTRMPIGAAQPHKTFATWLSAPELIDMFTLPYATGPLPTQPALNDDPGRARPSAFFNKLYGDCTKGEVTPHLTDVIWLPKKSRQRLKFTSRHGAAERLAAVSARLDALPASFDRYLLNPSGTYNCRPIAGTNRISPHGYGIAIDLNTKTTHYWGHLKQPANAPIAYRNTVPAEIVAAFEAEGFIWGGRWYHYDTMHFEYRPELFNTTSPSPRTRGEVP
jgi:D-alanyl-D-alanine carboxypeptidase